MSIKTWFHAQLLQRVARNNCTRNHRIIVAIVERRFSPRLASQRRTLVQLTPVDVVGESAAMHAAG